jgi:hypothetical protein
MTDNQSECEHLGRSRVWAYRMVIALAADNPDVYSETIAQVVDHACPACTGCTLVDTQQILRKVIRFLTDDPDLHAAMVAGLQRDLVQILDDQEHAP